MGKLKKIKQAIVAIGLTAAPILTPAHAATPKSKSAAKPKIENKFSADTLEQDNTTDSVVAKAQKILHQQQNNQLLLNTLAANADSAQIKILATQNDSLTQNKLSEQEKLRINRSLTAKINNMIKHHTIETDSVALDSAWNRLCGLEEKMLQFVAHFEDLRISTYRVHSKDPLTYGYGFTVDENGKPLKPGARIRSVKHLYQVWGRCVRNGHTERPKTTRELSQCLFGEMCQLLPINQMTDEQIIASGSFRYNGRPTFLKEKDGKSNYSTLMYRYAITLEPEDLDTLINLHARFCHSAGKIYPGLQKRRAVEASCIAGDIRLVLSQEEKDSLPEDLQEKALVLRELTVGASCSLDMATIKNAEEYINKVTEIKGDTVETQIQKHFYMQAAPRPKAKAPVKTNQPSTVRVRRGTRGK